MAHLDFITPQMRLDLAISRGDLQALKRALADGANINKPAHGGSPLVEAVNGKRFACVEYLLRSGADPCLCGFTGITPLAMAAWVDDAPLIELLLAHGADIEKGDAVGDQSPLMQAADTQRFEAVKTLIAHGADIQTKTKTGWGILDLAANNGLIETAKIMHGYGCRPALEKHAWLPKLLDGFEGRSPDDVVGALASIDENYREKFSEDIKALLPDCTETQRDSLVALLPALSEDVMKLRMQEAAGAPATTRTRRTRASAL